MRDDSAPPGQVPNGPGAGEPLVFVMGPTASGKTALALALAERFPMEILNVDSVQVYRGLEIGSAKPTPTERARVPHHLLDLTTPDDRFSAGRYHTAASAVIADCRARGVIPLLVGGSGLYFRALEQGLAPVPAIDPEIQARIRARGAVRGWPALHAELARIDPELAAATPPNHGQRIGRGLAVWEGTGRTLSDWRRLPHDKVDASLLKLAINWPRETLYARIDARFDQMMAQGLLEECARLLAMGFDRDLPAMKAVGYRQLFRHLDGELSLTEALELAKRESRRYAKRQLTWLRREAGLIWLAPEGVGEAIEWAGRFLGRSGGL